MTADEPCNEQTDTEAALSELELVRLSKAASRRLAAARGRLTKAEKSGDAEKIAAAQTNLDEVSAEHHHVTLFVLEGVKAHLKAEIRNDRRNNG